MVEIQNMLCNNLDKGRITCAVLLDLAKAFDSVNHNILLKKCEIFGIRGKASLLIKFGGLRGIPGTETKKQKFHFQQFLLSDITSCLVGHPSGLDEK